VTPTFCTEFHWFVTTATEEEFAASGINSWHPPEFECGI